MDGLGRAALCDLANIAVDFSGAIYTKDVNGALMKSGKNYRHYTGSVNPALIRTAFNDPMSSIYAKYVIANDVSSNLVASTWSANYDLSMSNFAYKFNGIATPLPDVSGAGTKIDDDIIFGSNGIVSFSTQAIYPAGATNNNVYANAPTNFNASSLTKSTIVGVAVTGTTAQTTIQSSLAGLTGTSPNADTIMNSLEFMDTLITSITDIVVQPSADLSGTVYRLAQTTVYDTGINDPSMADVTYNVIANPLYADVYPDYYVIYRALTSRALITLSTPGTDLTAGSVQSPASTLIPTSVPSSVLNSTSPAIRKNSVNVYMYGDANKTYGWKYTMDVYKVPVA
jgi:hypothetical protein